jgi:hypothetical protein
VKSVIIIIRKYTFKNIIQIHAWVGPMGASHYHDGRIYQNPHLGHLHQSYCCRSLDKVLTSATDTEDILASLNASGLQNVPI